MDIDGYLILSKGIFRHTTDLARLISISKSTGKTISKKPNKERIT